MDIKDLQKKVLEIKEKYKRLEIKQIGKEWSTKQLIEGFLTDVKDLLDLTANSKNHDVISHEISDCLWSVLVLANKLNIDLENSFMDNMNKLEDKINKDLKNYKA